MTSVKRKSNWKVNRKLIQIIKRQVKKRILRTNEVEMALKIIKIIKLHCEDEIRFKSTVKHLIDQIKTSGRTNMDPFWKYNKTIKKKRDQVGTKIHTESGERIEEKR